MKKQLQQAYDLLTGLTPAKLAKSQEADEKVNKIIRYRKNDCRFTSTSASSTARNVKCR